MAQVNFAKANLFRRKSLTIIIVLFLAVGGFLALHSWYTNNLRPVSSSSQIVYFPITQGATVHEVASDLKHANLIRNIQAFETYVRSKQLFESIQAGTYALKPSMSSQEIVKKITSGDVFRNLLTILPGKRLSQIRQAFSQSGYSKEELDIAFRASTYVDNPIYGILPHGADLEGVLYPDSFQKELDTPAQTIVAESLDEMNSQLTPDVLSGFKKQGLTTYQGITLASIVYQETDNPDEQPTVAQVFLTRLQKDMPLGSDVTAFYASLKAGQAPNLNVNSPYNTRLNKGLPPGPIGNMTASALKAVAHPSNTSYLYFVAGDDGKIHYSTTEAQHEQAIAKYCKKQCG